MWKADVQVTYKEGILEPQGQAVKDSLGSLGFDGISSVKIGKLIEVRVSGDKTEPEARQEIESMCKKLLANQVMETYSFTLKKL